MKNRIHVGAWNGVNEYHTIEDDFKQIAKSGMDFIIMTYTHDEKAVENLMWAEKYNVKCLIWDGTINNEKNITKEKVLESSKPYANSPSFVGFSLADEPSQAEYENLAKIEKACKEAYPDKDIHINLLPMYAASFVFGDLDFVEYLEDFVKKTDMPLSTDTYPFLIDDSGNKTTYDDYLIALDIQAGICRKYNRDFWLYIQSMEFLPNRRPDLIDFRFQVYTALAFGAKAILHFCYHMTGLPSDSDFGGAAICSNYTKSALWEYERIVNNELCGISDAYMQYKNVGAYICKAGIAPAYLELDAPYNGETVISDIDSTESLLVGVFEKECGDGSAFVIVNMSELKDNKMAEVSLKIKGEKKVTVYIKAIPMVLEPVEKCNYQFSLACGEGVFITVE